MTPLPSAPELSTPAALVPPPALPAPSRVAELAEYWRRRAAAVDKLLERQPPDHEFLGLRREHYANTAALLGAAAAGIDLDRRAWQQATLARAAALVNGPRPVDEAELRWLVDELSTAFATENNARGGCLMWRRLAEGRDGGAA